MRARRHPLWWAIRIAATLVLLGACTLIYAYWEATRDPVVRRAEMHLADWPAGTAPVTVLLVSDTHVVGPDMPPERLERIVAQLNALKPDLVLLAGDYISHKTRSTRFYSEAEAATPLTHFKAPMGTVAVLGNHDHWVDEEAMRKALIGGGVTMIANGAVRRGPLIIGGMDDSFSGHANVRQTRMAMDALGAGPRLLLTHTPDPLRRLPFKVDAMFAGHTHCGQIVLPFYGSLARDKMGFHWLPCGRVPLEAGPLVVTGGVGTSGVPFRLGAPPDVWLIRLGPRP